MTLLHICQKPDGMNEMDVQKIYPVLWSFRRCPYAIRARLALQVSQCRVLLREILLKEKPSLFIDVSPKSTVPVLVLPDGNVIEESLEIMLWSLRQSDPRGWLEIWDRDKSYCKEFLDELDNKFKYDLDHYKYSSRFDPKKKEEYRNQGICFLLRIEQQLKLNKAFISGKHFGLLDAATLPFVRQFRGVDENWFDAQFWPYLHLWISKFLQSKDFIAVMRKYQPWRPAEKGNLFP